MLLVKKTITRMLLMTVQKNLMTLFGEVSGYDYFFGGTKYSKNRN